MDPIIRRALILYGSQTGTAEDLSEELGTLLRYRHFEVQVSAMDSYPIQDLIAEKSVVFVCSTTGQGEEPDNMNLSWRFLLRRGLPADSLENSLYAVLGLGDSSYLKFNFVAKRLDKRLQQLGATSFFPLALADEQHDLGLDAVVLPWFSGICSRLLSLYPLPVGMDITPDSTLPPPKYNISFGHRTSSKEGSLTPSHGSQFSPTLLKLKSNARVTHIDHFQDTRLVIIDTYGYQMEYSPGDVAMVLPRNSRDVAEEFTALLGLDPNTNISVTPNEPTRPIPCNISSVCTLSDLAYSIDLTSRPRRSFFSLLSKLSPDQLERERLAEFSSALGQDDLFDYCYKPRKTLLEVLQDFPKTSPVIPLTYILDLVPAIRPRAFSIASSPLVHTGEIHLLVARVEYKTKLFNPRLGLCSNWLANLAPGDIIPTTIKRGTFQLSRSPNTVPYVMVGPGTGVAPFRSIITHRCFQGFGENYLFFGCRSSSKDYYFESEWNHLESNNYLRVFPAFSRDQAGKTYVQNIIIEKKPILMKLLENNCMVLIAGNAKEMPSSVLAAFRCVIKEMNSNTEIEAEEIIQHLIKQGRIQLETWH